MSGRLWFRDAPGLDYHQLVERRWFRAAPGFPQHLAGGNMHGTVRNDETVAVDTYLGAIPKRQYQVAPAEVVWHYLRVTELRAKGIPEAERITTMASEAKTKPWERMK